MSNERSWGGLPDDIATLLKRITTAFSGSWTAGRVEITPPAIEQDSSAQEEVAILPLQSRRPPWLENRIAASLTAKPTYLNNGALGNYIFYLSNHPNAVSTDALISMAEQHAGRPLRILDVGTGAGGFISECQDRGHSIIGISLHDYRKVWGYGYTRHHLNDQNYRVGDIQQPSTLAGIPGSFDIIVSRWTLQHLLDPIGTVEALANRVAVGGVLAFDYIPPQALQTDHRDPYEAIEQGLFVAGFQYITPNSSPSDDWRNGSRATSCILRRVAEPQPVRIQVTYPDVPPALPY